MITVDEAIEQLDYIRDDDGYTAKAWTALRMGAEALEKIKIQPDVIHCNECKFNYGIEHGCEWNPEDIVCTYYETDGMHKDDFCSRGKRIIDD